MDKSPTTFIDTDGQPVLLTADSVIAARPNDHAVGEDGAPYVTLVWVKGFRRHVALATRWSEFMAKLYGTVANDHPVLATAQGSAA